MVMISATQMLYCFVTAGVYLLVLSIVLEFVCRKLRLRAGIPAELIEESAAVWQVLFFIMEFLFFVVIPTLSYSFFYLIMPFSGIKAGLAGTLFAFTLGAVPIVMGLSMRIKLPMPYLLYTLLGYLLKLGGSMAVIGYLYTL